MQRHRVRPDPVSCQSCRSKKLKCNRVQPCSNCSARGISCIFLAPPQKQADRVTASYSNTELLARIERLEALVLKQEGSCKTTSSDRHTTQPPTVDPDSENIGSQNLREQEHVSRLLENVGTRDDSLLPHLSSRLVFKISGDNLTSETENPVIIFPGYTIATMLLQSYVDNVDHVCRILHIPSVRSLMRTVYLRLSHHEPVPSGQAALLLSMFALAAYFYHPYSNSEVASTRTEAIQLSKDLSRSALDVLDHSRRDTSGTLEDIQAYILMTYVSYHMDGFSARGRLLSTAAASIARELRLHRLDTEDPPCASKKPSSVRAMIDLEIKRRVFWHITSADWLLSFISGPQEGTYFINASYINVKLPRDCTDDDLCLGEDHMPTTRPQPTSMAFFLERVRLAHLCREMTDTIPLDTSKLMLLSYNRIIALDEKLEDYLASLPFFYKSDTESRRTTEPLEAMFPKIPVSRYCITVEAHSRRCKLHQRFLLRQSVDRRFGYSRQACLQSARVVIQAYEDLRQHDSPSSVPELMGMAVHFTHLALVVLAMDLCFNRDDVNEQERKAELRAALRMFEKSRHASPLLGRFLNSLKDVLRKHRVHLTETTTSAANEIAILDYGFSLDDYDEPLEDYQMQLVQDFDMLENPTSLDIPFDEFWQMATQSETDPDSAAWDHLFSTLDSRPL